MAPSAVETTSRTSRSFRASEQYYDCSPTASSRDTPRHTAAARAAKRSRRARLRGDDRDLFVTPSPSPEQLTIALLKVTTSLRRNPSPAASTARSGRRHLLSRVEALAARALVQQPPSSRVRRRVLLEFVRRPRDRQASIPGGRGRRDVARQWERGARRRPVSACGWCRLLPEVDGRWGTRIRENYLRLLMAPGCDDHAPRVLRRE